MRKFIAVFLTAVVLCCCAEEQNADVSGKQDMEAVSAKLTEAEGRLDKLEKEVKQLRAEVDKLNELTATLTKALRNLQIATQGGASIEPEMDTWQSVKKGMTAEEVQEMLGSPEEITQSRSEQVWYYYSMGTITFDRNGRVIYQETKKQLPMENKVR